MPRQYSVFPSILPSDEPFVDDKYQEKELQRKDYNELKSIAAEHDSEDVHGRMSADELVKGLTGKERL